MDLIDSMLEKIVEKLPIASAVLKNKTLLRANELLTHLADPHEITHIALSSTESESRTLHRLKDSFYSIKRSDVDDTYSLLFLSKSDDFNLVYDDLTGALDRECLHQVSAQLLEEARMHGKILAFLFIDLDGFKLVNDNWGHETGDLVLKKTGERIAYTIRKNDYCIRMGGDEFVVILTDLQDRMHSCLIARRLLSAISEPIVTESGQTLVIGSSIGIAAFPADGDREEELIHKADEAMYRAKKIGSNNYQLCQ